MAKQNPGTTVHNLILAGRRLKVAETINPPDLVQGARAAQRGLTPQGTSRPESINPVIPFQTLSWYVEGSVIVDSSIEREMRLPQLARGIRLYADAKGAPSSGPMTADLYSNGVFVENVSIPEGQTEEYSDLIDLDPLPAFARLRVAITATGGASSVTVSLVYQPMYE